MCHSGGFDLCGLILPREIAGYRKAKDLHSLYSYLHPCMHRCIMEALGPRPRSADTGDQSVRAWTPLDEKVKVCRRSKALGNPCRSLREDAASELEESR